MQNNNFFNNGSFSYPQRDPQNESNELKIVAGEGLDFINHWYYSGKRDFSQNFSFLSAGGETGDSAIYMAEQLRDTDNQVVYLGDNEASMDIAKHRAQVRQIDNIQWVKGSILDLPTLGLGEFDHISCTGALSRLESPSDGFSALASSLKEDGAISVKMYAKYGRAAIYQVKEIMTLLNMGVDDIQQKLENCKDVLKHLPESHAFKTLNIEKNTDYDLQSDGGIYDLFLQPYDKAFSVVDLYQLVEAAGLKVGVLYGFDSLHGNLAYSPEPNIKDPELLEKVRTMHPIIQTAICESINGNIHKHNFSVVKEAIRLPDVTDLDNIPSLSNNISHAHSAMLGEISKGQYCFAADQDSGVKVMCNKSDRYVALFEYIDGNRTIGQIIELAKIKLEGEVNEDRLLEDFSRLFGIFNNYNQMYLRHNSVPGYKSVQEIQDRVRLFAGSTVGA